jgi:hypothetical protein
LNIFSARISSSLMFLLVLLQSVSVELTPLRSYFVFVSSRSTTEGPTLCVSLCPASACPGTQLELSYPREFSCGILYYGASKIAVIPTWTGSENYPQ